MKSLPINNNYYMESQDEFTMRKPEEEEIESENDKQAASDYIF